MKIKSFALGIILIGTLSACQKSPTGVDKVSPVLTVDAVKSQVITWERSFTATGNVLPWQEASIGSEIGGLRIKEILVDVGTIVKKDDVLARLNNAQAEMDVLQANAAVKDAEAVVAQADSVYTKAKSLPPGAISDVDLTQYKTALTAARAKLQSAKAQYNIQNIKLTNTLIKAPDDGVISSRAASVGTVVNTGTELFKLIRKQKVEWKADVGVEYINRLKVGLPVELNGPGATGTGTISKISPTIDANLRTGVVYVSAPPTFKSGMFIKGTFGLEKENIRVIPSESLLVRDGYTYVPTIVNNRIEMKKVTIGDQKNNLTEVVSGLTGDELIAKSGSAFLNNGDLVRVVESKQ